MIFRTIVGATIGRPHRFDVFIFHLIRFVTAFLNTFPSRGRLSSVGDGAFTAPLCKGSCQPQAD
ncbi:MAG: hypothetical protein IJL63_10130 [Clostridia bacterium]|nr:hypothetical protein [Clostridia bacterium]